MNGKATANYRTTIVIKNPSDWDGVWYLNRHSDQSTDPLDAYWFALQVFNQAFTADDALFEYNQTKKLFE